MQFILQFPFADIRDFLDYDTGKLPTPLWPIPIPDFNFIRSLGVIRERKQGGLTGWIGENIICQANHAIRFNKIPPFIIEKTQKPVSIEVTFRRFYSDGNVLGKYEIGLQVGNKDNIFSGKQFMDLICQILNLDVTIPNPIDNPQKCKFWRSGKYLSNLYNVASTKTKYLSQNQPLLSTIKPCRPLIIIVNDGEIQELPLEGKVIPASLNRKTSLSFHNYSFQGINLPLWIINREPFDEARKLRIYLSRLHSERECLKTILSSIANGSIEVKKRDKSDLLQHYLNTATRHVIRLQNKSSNIDDRIGIIADEVIDLVTPGEKQAIIDTLRNISVRLNILHKVIDFVNELDESNYQEKSYLYSEVDSIENPELKNNILRAISNLKLDTVDLGLFDLARILENEIRLYLENKVALGDERFTKRDLQRLASMIESVEREGIVTHSRELHFLREERNERAHGAIPDLVEREKLMRHSPFLADLYIKYIIFFCSLRTKEFKLSN